MTVLQFFNQHSYLFISAVVLGVTALAGAVVLGVTALAGAGVAERVVRLR